MRNKGRIEDLKIRELTPTAMRCIFGQCPALFETDRETLIVIGRVLEDPTILEGRIGKGEVAIEVPRNLFKTNPPIR
jgi:hypothetical protein